MNGKKSKSYNEKNHTGLPVSVVMGIKWKMQTLCIIAQNISHQFS